MVKDNENTEILNVGLVGHIDHGKTTLLQRLSGKWADTHSEELKRGITIKLGYADSKIYKHGDSYNTNGQGEKVRDVSYIDAPGHEMLMATMLSGAALVDVALLIIAANEGIKPQTREHLMALQAKGIKKVIVIQNKIDLVDEKRALESYDEIKEFLKGRFDDAPIIPVSAQQGINIDVILKALCDIKIPERDLDSDPLFLVARSFDINKPGTLPSKLSGSVLGGTLKQGVLKVGDKIEIKPGRIVKEANQYKFETINTKVKGVFKSGKPVDQLTPGGSVAIETELDMSLGKGDALSGNVISLCGKLPELVEKVKLNYELFSDITGKGKIENLKHGETVLLSINTSLTGGAISGLKGEEVEVNLKKPVVVFHNEHVGIARNIQNHWRLIGCGKVC